MADLRGTSPNSLANLEKGRNKNGAPRKGMSWKELITAIGDEINEESGMTWKEAVVRAAYYHAVGGNAAILKELWQRSEPIADAVDVNVNDSRIEPTDRRARILELLELARIRGTDMVA